MEAVCVTSAEKMVDAGVGEAVVAAGWAVSEEHPVKISNPRNKQVKWPREWFILGLQQA